MNAKQTILTKCAPWQIDVAAAAIAVLATLLAYFALLEPLQTQRAEYARQDRQYTAQQKEAVRLTALRFVLGKQLEELQANLAAQKVQLRPLTQVNRRVAEVTAMVNRCGLKTANVTLGQVTAGPRWNTIPIRLVGSGDYRNCMSFLHELAGPKSDFAVAGFEITGNPQKTDEPAKFSFDLYWYAALETAAAN